MKPSMQAQQVRQSSDWQEEYMGKATGFLEYEREDNITVSPLERIKNFDEFHNEINEEKRRKVPINCIWENIDFPNIG